MYYFQDRLEFELLRRLGMQLNLLEEVETSDEGMELKIEGEDPKCGKILSDVSFAMRNSIRKCGFKETCGTCS